MNGIIFYKLTEGRLYDSDTRDIISYNLLKRRGPTSNERKRIKSQECTFLYENQLYYLYTIDFIGKKVLHSVYFQSVKRAYKTLQTFVN